MIIFVTYNYSENLFNNNVVGIFRIYYFKIPSFFLKKQMGVLQRRFSTVDINEPKLFLPGQMPFYKIGTGKAASK